MEREGFYQKRDKLGVQRNVATSRWHEKSVSCGKEESKDLRGQTRHCLLVGKWGERLGSGGTIILRGTYRSDVREKTDEKRL